AQRRPGEHAGDEAVGERDEQPEPLRREDEHGEDDDAGGDGPGGLLVHRVREPQDPGDRHASMVGTSGTERAGRLTVRDNAKIGVADRQGRRSSARTGRWLPARSSSTSSGTPQLTTLTSPLAKMPSMRAVRP